MILLAASEARSQRPPPPLQVTSMKAMLFYEDTGGFSADVSDADTGPPYVPPRLWNTPLQYENRSTSVLITVEIAGEPEVTRQFEFVARYVPMGRSRAIIVRRVMALRIGMKVADKDNYHIGFWLYDTGCEPVKLSARIIGSKGVALKRVIKFGCGE